MLPFTGRMIESNSKVVGLLAPESDKKHSETFGGLMLYFQLQNFAINLYYTPGELTHVSIYQDLTALNFCSKSVEDFTNGDWTNLEWVVSITPALSNHLLCDVPPHKIIYVLHMESERQDYMKKVICLTPLLRRTIQHCIFPVYRLSINRHPDQFSQIVCTIIGHAKNYRMIQSLSRCRKVVLQIIDKHIDPEIQKRFAKQLNVFVFKDVASAILATLIQNSHFVVPAIHENGFHWRPTARNQLRLCSSIPIAITFERPLIIQRSIAKTYQIAGSGTVAFNDLIDETFPVLKRMNLEKYQELVRGIISTREMYIQKNLNDNANLLS